MVTRIINGKVLVDGQFSETELYFDGKTIIGTGKDLPFDRTIDAKGNYVTAGFVDLHCHGGGGGDFADGDPESVRKATLMHLQYGTTTLFPTISSRDFETLERAVAVLDEVKDQYPSLAGTHLEGPYFSPAQLGAQNAKAIMRPDPADFGRVLKGHNIVRWDYAPDVDEGHVFLNALKEAGVVAAAAHTDATCTQMEEAADNGCTLITHLYSCTSTIRREFGFRIAGVTEAAYLRDDVSAELIADGCHLPHTLLRLAYKLKGPDRLALVTDAMRATGVATEGQCEIAGNPCIIEDGVAKLLDRSAFAGSVSTADRLVRTCVAAGIPLADSVKMLTETPARIMNLANKGKLEAGRDADIVIFDEDIQIQTVILQGEIVA